MFATMGGRGASHLCLRSAQVPSAPTKVAREPNTTSQGAQPVIMLLRRHPTNKPGTAAGVKKGRTVKASENRTWMA